MFRCYCKLYYVYLVRNILKIKIPAQLPATLPEFHPLDRILNTHPQYSLASGPLNWFQAVFKNTQKVGIIDFIIYGVKKSEAMQV